MNKTFFDESQNSDDELMPEYHFDYQKAKPNRFATDSKKQNLTVILDEDVAQVFTTSEIVNKALRALIKGIPSGMNNLTIEQRLATLEQTVAELKLQINDASNSSNWLQKVIGSISDESAFIEALEYGRSLRQADKPKNQLTQTQIEAVQQLQTLQGVEELEALQIDSEKSKEEADNLQ